MNQRSKHDNKASESELNRQLCDAVLYINAKLIILALQDHIR